MSLKMKNAHASAKSNLYRTINTNNRLKVKIKYNTIFTIK